MIDSLHISGFQNAISIAKDIINILFFVIIGIITILTYLKAKQTLLQPIKTEIFKEQLKVFSEILSFFSGKTEIDLRKDSAMENFFTANTLLLFDEYAKLFFDIEMDEDKRPYNTKDCRIARIRAEFLESADNHLKYENEKKEIEYPDPRLRATIWNKFTMPRLCFPNTTSKYEEQLDKLMESPLIPNDLLKLIEEFKNVLEDNINTAEIVLNDIAKELPEKYPNLGIMKKASLSWVSNRYNEKFKHLKEPADKITNYLRNYFSVDNIIK